MTFISLEDEWRPGPRTGKVWYLNIINMVTGVCNHTLALYAAFQITRGLFTT